MRERLQLLEMDQSAARAEQRTLATTESVLQLERDVAQQLHRQLERIATFETDRLGAAVSRMHGLQVPPLPEGSGPAGGVSTGRAGYHGEERERIMPRSAGGRWVEWREGGE